MTRPALIDIHNATIWRGSTRVFEGLNLRIEQDERVAILGPNGSGKTTLLKLINRELYPVVRSDSHVRILGQDRWNVWELRKRIGIVSHDLQQRYTPTTKALAVVLSGYYSSIGVHGTLSDRFSDQHRDAAKNALDELGIGALSDARLKHLSTGQQRRVLLARALVHRPQTLILDEPTSGLDLSASFDYLRRIRDLAARGHNIVLVTHHLGDIPPDVKRVILLSEGRVVADGKKADVLTSETLSSVYQTPIRLTEVGGYYLASPAD